MLKRKAIPRKQKTRAIAKPKPQAGFVMTVAQKLQNLLDGLRGMASEKFSRRKMFEIHQPFPGVVPVSTKKETLLAMDNAIGSMSSFAFAMGGWDQAGFLGYAFLSELSQITEYRRPAEILANEMTRKWGKLVSTSDDEASKRKLKELEDDLKKFNVQEVFGIAFELDNFFGIGHIYIDVGTEGEELKSPLLINKTKIGVGTLKALRPVEPMWTYPNVYNANNPLKDQFYDPETWFVMGTEVNKSRLLRFISRPIPDMLKPAYLFGGVSLTQLMEPYVNNWLQTRQSVSEITRNYSTPVLKTDMDQMTQTQGAQVVANRAAVYNIMRTNQGLLVCDKEKEDFEIVSASLSGLSELQAQAIEQMAFPAGIPLVKLLGVTPSGLNASSDGEVRTFYDSIASLQEKVGTPNLMKIIEILQLNRYGVIDPGIKWEWAQLWELDEEKKAALRKTDAETDVIYLEAGILDGKAILDKLSSDPDSRYAGLDLGELPDPLAAGQNDLSLEDVVGEVSAKSILKDEEDDPRETRQGRAAPEPRPARTAEEARPAEHQPPGRGEERNAGRSLAERKPLR